MFFPRPLRPGPLFSSALFGAFISVLSACGDGGGSSAPVDNRSTFERIQTDVFDVSCSSDSCHSSVGRAGGLIVEAGQSYDQLMLQPPTNLAAKSHGLMRIMPGQPDQSFLLAKITDTLSAGEGLSMPYNAAPLDDATVEVVRAWIE